MSAGVYGMNVPSNIKSSDVDIYYSYSNDRSSTNSTDVTFTKLSSNILVKAQREIDTGSTMSGDTEIEGAYQLKLPSEYFSAKGFYTVYIKPREVEAVISEVSVLMTYPDVRGIIIDASTIKDNDFKALLLTDNGISGYRIVYYDDNGERMDDYKIVTSNFRAEAVVQNLTTSNQKNITYIYNSTSTLVFLTLTPSSSPSYKSNAYPFIGKPSQKILFINTKFNPIMLELEMTDYDAESISTMLEGTQIRDLDHGLITTLNNDGEIYHQSENYQLKDTSSGEPMYEIHRKKNNIDTTQTLDNIENT
jgi:hypothetical protein